MKTFKTFYSFLWIMRADKIIVLDQGKIVEEGLHSDLINKTGGIYKKLWELQTEMEIE